MARSKHVRKTVNFDPGEAAALERVLEDGSPERLQLAQVVGEGALPYGDSAAIASLVRVGLATLQEQIIERGYRELATSQTEEDRAFEVWAVDNSRTHMMTDEG